MNNPKDTIDQLVRQDNEFKALGAEEAWSVERQIELCLKGDPERAGLLASESWCAEEARLGFLRTAPLEIVKNWFEQMVKNQTRISEAAKKALVVRGVGVKEAIFSREPDIRKAVWEFIQKGNIEEPERWSLASSFWYSAGTPEEARLWVRWAVKKFENMHRDKGAVEALTRGEPDKLANQIRGALQALIDNKGVTGEQVLMIDLAWGDVLEEVHAHAGKNEKLAADIRLNIWTEMLSGLRAYRENGDSMVWDFRKKSNLAAIFKTAAVKGEPGLSVMAEEAKGDEILLSAIESMTWFKESMEHVNPKWLAPFIGSGDKRIRERALKVVGLMKKREKKEVPEASLGEL